MSRRSFLVAVGIVLLLGGAVSGTLYALLSYEPGHYRRAAVPAGPERCKMCKDCQRELFDFWDAIKNDHDGWHCRLTDEQINSYLDEEFMRSGVGEKVLPDMISEPRIVFAPERLRLAFRYRSGLFNTIVSVDLRLWLPKGESNVVAVQLEGLRAGALPFKAQWLLEQISEVARQNGIEVNWYRHDGYSVALLRFQADQARPTVQLKAIKLESGRITIQGTTGEDRAALPSLREAVCRIVEGSRLRIELQ